jgi:DNA helicase-2/ATP-dependent DNA helicase PcrA
LSSSRKWNLDKNAKILLLTHKGIANKLGYANLINAYEGIAYGRDRLLNKEEIFAGFFLGKLEPLVKLYVEKQYSQFINQLGIEGFKVERHTVKVEINKLIRDLIKLRNEATVKEVMEYVLNNSLIARSQRIDDFQTNIAGVELDEEWQKKKKFHDALMALPYKELIAINEYIEDYTPYSTKHGVKGAEYENVLMVIDDNSWNQYKFNDVFSCNRQNEQRYNRTRNLLYVCCSRAKNELAILALSEINPAALTNIEEWFGSENVYDIVNLRT